MGRRVEIVVEVAVEEGIVGSGTAVSASRSKCSHASHDSFIGFSDSGSLSRAVPHEARLPRPQSQPQGQMADAPPAADAASGYAGAADSINAGQAPARKANRFSLISNLLEDMGVTQEQKLVLAICMCCIMLYWRYTGAIGPNKKKR